MDKMTKEQRHHCMASIRGKNTRPELIVRKFLFGRGFRYRLNHPRLPGHPDIVLRRYRTVIFVNGCFWHGHEGCRSYVVPKTNTQFWQKKIERNRERDVEEQRRLAVMGWHCITVWECQLKPTVRQQTLESLAFTLNSIYLRDHEVRHGNPLPADGSGLPAVQSGRYCMQELNDDCGIAAEPHANPIRPLTNVQKEDD